MKMKRLVVFIVVMCMLFATPVGAGMKTHWMRSSGTYSIYQMGGKRSFKLMVRESTYSKKMKKELLQLYNKNPRKLYKKYKKKIKSKYIFMYTVFKTKIKNNILTVWGKFSKKNNGVKKKYKFGKYKFKISRKATLVETQLSDIGPTTYKHSTGSKMKKLLKEPYGRYCSLVVSGGKIIRINLS